MPCTSMNDYSKALRFHRCHEGFVETDSMSEIAKVCTDVGLKSLFLTSLKIYKDIKDDEQEDGEEERRGVGTKEVLQSKAKKKNKS